MENMCAVTSSFFEEQSLPLSLLLFTVNVSFLAPQPLKEKKMRPNHKIHDIYRYLQNTHLCYIAIHEYVKRTCNVHNIGIPKHEKHLRLLSSGTKLFITFELKGFST